LIHFYKRTSVSSLKSKLITYCAKYNLEKFGAEMMEAVRKEVVDAEYVVEAPVIMHMRRSRQSQYSILNSSIPQSNLIQAIQIFKA